MRARWLQGGLLQLRSETAVRALTLPRGHERSCFGLLLARTPFHPNIGETHRRMGDSGITLLAIATLYWWQILTRRNGISLVTASAKQHECSLLHEYSERAAATHHSGMSIIVREVTRYKSIGSWQVLARSDSSPGLLARGWNNRNEDGRLCGI